MRILVVHAWLRGNLGDVLQLSVLLSALRDLKPRILDLAGFPARPADAAGDLLTLTDRYLADPFAWYWTFFPRFVAKMSIEPLWKRRRKTLFSRYDAIVCAPGPYLAGYDARAPSALCDITSACELGLPVVLSSHSIGPLSTDALAVVARATVRIAREPSTYEYLRERGISCSLAADLAFLYPYDEIARAAAFAPLRFGVPRRSSPEIESERRREARAYDTTASGSIEPPYRLIFLRSNNLDARSLRLEDGALFEGSRMIAEASTDRLVLATSDYRRDRRFLAVAARRLGVPWVGCRTVTELVQLIHASSGVVSDRYHPAICAAVLGRPAQVVPNREPHKMHGLKNLLADRPLEELQELARAGLSTLRNALRSAV